MKKFEDNYDRKTHLRIWAKIAETIRKQKSNGKKPVPTIKRTA